MTLIWLIIRASILTPWLGYLCWSDAKRRSLPNVLTFGGLVVGLCAQVGFNGVGGLTDGICGAGLGVLFMLIPFLIGAVGAGDLKMLAACGAFVGVRLMPLFLMSVAFAGPFVLIGILFVNPVARARMRHLLRCVFDWRYDRKAGAAALPVAKKESTGVPYGVAIALGMWVTLAMEAYYQVGG